MKIVHLGLSCFYIEGFGYQENLIPKYNKKDGHEVTMIASRLSFDTHNGKPVFTNVGEYENADGIKVVRIDYKKGFLRKIYILFRVYNGTYKAIEKENPDLIFMHGIQFWDMREVARYIKKNPKCKLIADTHATFENSALNWMSKNLLHKVIWKKIIKDSLQYIRRIYCVTPSAMKFASEFYNIQKEKMEYLYLGADTEKIDFKNINLTRSIIRKKLGISDDDIVIISGGKLTKRKNVDLMLDAINKIDNDKIRIILFGSIADNIRDELLYKINRDKRVKYIGWIDSKETYDYFMASDLAVFLGSQSALWQQAICSGLPTIFNNSDDIDYLDLGGNTIILKNADINLVKEKINYIIDHPAVLSHMKQVARKYGYDTFSYKQIARKSLNI